MKFHVQQRDGHRSAWETPGPESSGINHIKVTMTVCRLVNQQGGKVSHGPHLSVANPAFPLMGDHHFPNCVLPLSLEVVAVDEPQNKDEKINHAVSTLIPVASERRQGILVIQRDYGKYTVRVDQEVPCGMIHESLQ